MKRLLRALTISCCIVLTGCTSGAATLPGPPSQPVGSSISVPQLKFSMVIASLSGAFAIPWIADATGAFTRHGVSVSIPYMEQTNAAFAAMVAGDVDAMEVSAGPVITANVNGNLDLVYVAAIMNHPQFALIVGPSIRTVADLKGKALATDQPYQGPDYGMQVALSKLGLTPADVQLRRVGGPALAWAALNSKQVDGAILAPPFTFAAEKAGYHAIVDIYDQPYQNVGIVMPRSRIDALKPALLAVLPALREAMQTYNEQADIAIRVLSENTKETDPIVLEKTYEFYKTQAPWEPSLEPTLPGIQGMMDFLVAGVPGVKNTMPEQYVDRRILDVLSGYRV